MQSTMQGLRHYTLVLAIMDSDKETYNIFNTRSSDESELEPQEIAWECGRVRLLSLGICKYHLQ